MHIVPGMILSLPVNANGSLIPFEEELNIWPFALIQMAFSDILELGSQQKRVGMLWHSLSLSSSSADELNKLCHPGALLPESDLTEHLLPSGNCTIIY